MPVNDIDVAALRAQLKRDDDEFRRLKEQHLKPNGEDGYAALMYAAYFLSVDQRFPEGWTESEVVQFVANMRSRGEAAAKIDPGIAERIILHSLGTGEEGDIDDIDLNDLEAHRYIILFTITVDERFDEAGLDEFLARARETGEEVLRMRAEAAQR